MTPKKNTLLITPPTDGMETLLNTEQLQEQLLQQQQQQQQLQTPEEMSEIFQLIPGVVQSRKQRKSMGKDSN